MKRGDELALDAMEKEHKRLSLKASRAKASYDEWLNVGHELIAIILEFRELTVSGKPPEEQLKKLKELKQRQEKADKIKNKDGMAIIDTLYDAERERDALGLELGYLRAKIDLRSAKP